MAEKICDVLHRQHEDAKETLDKLSSLSPEYVAVRRDKEITAAIDLISHFEAESQVLYQRLMEVADLRDVIGDHQRVDDDTNEKLRALLYMNVKESDSLEHVKNIREAVGHHIEDEETHLFPRIRNYFDAAEAEKLAERFLEAQQRRKELLRVASRDYQTPLKKGYRPA